METEDSPDPQELKATLATYKKLAEDFSNHDTILKVIYYFVYFDGCGIFNMIFIHETRNFIACLQDKTVLSYIAFLMENPDVEVVKLSLDVLEIFVRNLENYSHITSTFGVREALDSIIDKYGLDEPKIAKHAQYIKDSIERMKPPIYNLRSRCRRVIEPKKLRTHVIVLHVHGLLPVSCFLITFHDKNFSWQDFKYRHTKIIRNIKI